MSDERSPTDPAADAGQAADGPAAAEQEPIPGEADLAEQSPPEAVSDAEPGSEPVFDLEELAASDPRTKAEMLGELVVAEHKRDEYLDDLRRSHADFENYRRRVMREGAVQREAGKADVAGGLLEVLDDLDRTLQAADGSADHDLAKGVTLVAEKLVKALRDVGLERVDEAGVPFDPNVHEAVSQVPGERPGDDPVVAEIFRPGYRLGDRVLRAAMVVVAQ